jgi:hypothetical protein
MDIAASHTRHTSADLTYDAILIGGLGGGIVALFFLVLDVITRGQALFTPSLMGNVLFDGASAASVVTVDMAAVAKYSALHLVLFSLLGLGIAILTQQAEIRSKHPLLVIGLVFAIIETAFWVGASLAIPGVLDRLGVLPVAAANLLAAVGVGLFLVSTHRGHLWGTRRS